MSLCMLIPFPSEAMPNIFNSSNNNNNNIINQHKAVSFIPTIMFSHKPKTITFIFPFRFDYIFCVCCVCKRVIRTHTHKLTPQRQATHFYRTLNIIIVVYCSLCVAVFARVLVVASSSNNAKSRRCHLRFRCIYIWCVVVGSRLYKHSYGMNSHKHSEK